MSVMASVGCQKPYFIKMFLMVKKKQHTCFLRGLVWGRTQPLLLMLACTSLPELWLRWRGRLGMQTLYLQPRVAYLYFRWELCFRGNNAPNCATASHPCKGLEVPPAPWAHTGHAAASKSQCPRSALSHVLGTLAATTVLWKQIFVHFNKALHLLIHPVHILIKIQTPSVAVWDIWKESNALLLQPYSSIICFHNKSFLLFLYKPLLHVAVWSTHYLFLPSLYSFGLGIVHLPVLD